MATALAAAMFKESTPPAIGILTTRSAPRMARRESPSPSVPKIIAPPKAARIESVPVPEQLAIVQGTPFAWEVSGEVNGYVSRVSDELARRGHRVLIMAPSESGALVRETRRTLRKAPESLLGRADSGPVVLGVGEVLPFAPA